MRMLGSWVQAQRSMPEAQVAGEPRSRPPREADWPPEPLCTGIGYFPIVAARCGSIDRIFYNT
ncbi:hypothetical protein [Pseudarthrobacter sp. NIBRBAC000502771]|uniref:hypothetical protein n=1 Tax=Pseudarthrobacter sp. NIBRBAC000502771 TaxID=2590774 RepID=UPI00143D5BA8|nr:hypothetical protein [Pseudarthrobacter sp. NIBRBAC000502771]